MVQVATSSAPDLTGLETQISKIAMRINSKYSTLTHQPLVLLKQDISFTQFLALMSVAEIFMITSLREGMNLSGHDFVACQDGTLGNSQKYGSLILSEFTGSASTWSGHELLVNPWNYVQCAEAINRALLMSNDEKKRNWQVLADRMAQHTATMWCDNYLKELCHAYDAQSSRQLHNISSLQMDAVREKYTSSKNRFFILEDQVIFPEKLQRDNSKSDFSAVLSVLTSLSSNPNNSVYVASSLGPKYLNQLLVDLPRVGVIAENGAFLREPGNPEWQQLLDESDTIEWRRGIQKVMEYFQERTEGSSIEERQFSLTFNYKSAVDSELATRQAAELNDQINGSRGNVPIRAVLTDGAVTVEHTNVTKATTAELVLQRFRQSQPHEKDDKEKDDVPDFLCVAGYPRASEILFSWASRLEREGRVRNVMSLVTDTHATPGLISKQHEVLISGLASLINS